MITVFTETQGDAGALKETVDSLLMQGEAFREKLHLKVLCESAGETREALSECGNLHDIELVETGGRRLGEILEQMLPRVTTELVTVIREGELYGEGSLELLCQYLLSVKDETDAAVPRSLRSRKNWEEPNVMLKDRAVYDLSRAEYVLQTPGVLGGTVFVTEALRTQSVDYRFGAGAWEEFVIRILLRKGTLAYVNDALFCTAGNLDGRNTLAFEYGETQWYLDTARNYCVRMIEQYRRKDGSVPLFVQAQVLFILKLQFRRNMGSKDKGMLFGETLEQYLGDVRHCLGEISGALLLARGPVHYQRRVAMTILPALLALKFEPYRDSLRISGTPKRVCCERYGTDAAQGFEPYIVFQLMEAENGRWRIDFAIDRFVAESALHLEVTANGREVPVREVHRFAHRKFFGQRLTDRKTLVLELPISDLEKRTVVEFVLRDGAGGRMVLPVITGDYQTKLTRKLRNSYWCFDRYMAVLRRSGDDQTDGIVLKRAGRITRIARELGLLKEILFSRFGSKRMFALRILYWLTYPALSKKNIWVTFDKLYKGGDCGEYFYKYMETRRRDGVVPVYVINADAPDRRRLEKEGYQPTVYGTWRQKLYYLHAKMVFATHSAVHSFCGLSKWEVRFVQDRIRAVNTCIQHGLSVQDLTLDSNRIVNNNKRYYCASRFEVENLSKPEYDYGPDVLTLTGIPRYDGLVNRDKKQILITPTWRSYIAMPAVMGSARPYNPEFKDTDYYKIFQELLENQRLARAARETGYRVIYLLHPVISSQKEDFQTPEGIELLSALEINYEQILTESSLMVTDYSGVQFDFAYMRKPVVYFHPPKLPPHYEEGGFFYETQGFGEICTETEQLVDTLCEYMRSGCRLKDFYRARQDDFFAFDDHDSCRRIFEDGLRYQTEHGIPN